MLPGSNSVGFCLSQSLLSTQKYCQDFVHYIFSHLLLSLLVLDAAHAVTVTADFHS